jgi:hypothetical protein
MAPMVTLNYIRFASACEIQWVAHAMEQSVLKPTWYSHGEANAQTDTVGTGDDGFCLYSQFCYNATVVFL